MKKLRVLYTLYHYPQISESYIKSEIEAVAGEYDLKITAERTPDTPYQNAYPYEISYGLNGLRKIFDAFRPDVIHSHWLDMVDTVHELARDTGVPYTIRTHSFDVLLPPIERLRGWASLINSDLCLGILAFPATRPRLLEAGYRPDKAIECFPVVKFDRFYDPSPNGDAIMNVGACIPKKKMEDYLDLAKRLPDQHFDLYAMGYEVARFHTLRKEMQSPVRLIPAVEPDLMPAEFKKHRWMVYTACPKLKTIGWPLAVAEAQASGVGVCLANVRPDLQEYLGDAGYLFDSIDELADIISKPFPDEKRQIGFELAKRSDIAVHKKKLTDLWEKARQYRSKSFVHQRLVAARVLGRLRGTNRLTSLYSEH